MNYWKRFSALLLSFILIAVPIRALAENASLQKIFKAHSLTKHSKAISDYGKLHRSTGSYFSVKPTTPEETAAIISLAHQHRVPLRIRGKGHSLHGASLPRKGELLLLTEGLRSVLFEEVGSVTAGAGIGMWELDAFLRVQGFRLPMVNGGSPGPSVGGFFVAGGVTAQTKAYGGFWDNVLEVELIDGTGKRLNVPHGSELYRWLPGSIGQLGLVSKLKLRILRIENSTASYPKGFMLASLPRPPITHEDTSRLLEETTDTAKIYWFGLLCPLSELEKTEQMFLELTSQYPRHLLFRVFTRYHFLQPKVVPPLLYPEDTDFGGIELHGTFNPKSEKEMELLKRFERELFALALAHKLRRYPQVEYLPEGFSFKEYFDEATYKGFLQKKRRLDPENIFNRGSVFPLKLETSGDLLYIQKKTRKNEYLPKR